MRTRGRVPTLWPRTVMMFRRRFSGFFSRQAYPRVRCEFSRRLAGCLPDCLPTGNIFRLQWASLHGTLRLQACAFFPLEPSEPSGTAKRPGSLAAPPPAPLLPAPPRDGALRAAPRNLADARAPPLVHRARTSPATRRPLHRRATRRTGRPVRPPGHRGRLRAFARGRRVLRRAPRAQRRAVLLSRALPHPPPAATECARPRSRQRSQKVWGEHACRRPVSVRRPSGASSTTRAPLPDATPTATRPSTSTGTSTPGGDAEPVPVPGRDHIPVPVPVPVPVPGPGPASELVRRLGTRPLRAGRMRGDPRRRLRGRCPGVLLR